MKLRDFATATVIGTFVIIAVTGILMFFKVKSSAMEAAHEWLGIVFVIAGLFHIVVNWKAFANYFKKTTPVALITISLAAGVVLYALNSTGKPHPAKQVVFKMTKAPVAKVAPALGMTGEEIISKLREKGLHVNSSDETLEQIARDNNHHPFKVLDIIMSDKS